MAFKIVQTIEDNVPKLTVVPMHWESDGIVRWPPRTIKNASKLIKNENSRPGPDWDYLKCVLKRNFIPTYEEANNELCLMQQNTDTDDNDNCSIPAQTFSKPDRANNEINFDAIAAQLSESQTPVVPVSCGQQQETIQIYNSDEIQTVIANQAAIMEQLVTVVENQKKIAFKLASLSIQLEETKASISKEQERPVNVTLLQDQLRMEENEAFCITQIENQHQFDILETNLGDKAHKKKFTKTLSLLCSSTEGGGITCAYKLLDVLFTRDFLCKCSWSGGSKGEMSKIPFKNYINFRQFFFEIINSWDSTFTDDDSEKFLKLVVRNATKRKAMKGLRQSTKRTRKSKNHGNVEKRGEEVEVDDESNDNNKEETQAKHTSSVNEPQAGLSGSETNVNQRKESQTDKNRKQPEYNKDSSDEEMELC